MHITNSLYLKKRMKKSKTVFLDDYLKNGVISDEKIKGESFVSCMSLTEVLLIYWENFVY